MSYQPYNAATASTTDRIAWVLCQLIDDDAPMRWTRYRFAACIALNDKLMSDLQALALPGTLAGKLPRTSKPPACAKSAQR